MIPAGDLWHVGDMDNIELDLPRLDATDCFQMSLAENIALIAEMLEAVRDESDLIGDVEIARFAAGVRDAVLAFGSLTNPLA